MSEETEKEIQKEPVVTDLGDGIYNLSTPPVGFQEYLVLGNDRALLIDTGMGACSLRPTIEAITPLPVTVINTHGHPDHAGGNAEFDPPLMCPADFDVYEQMATRSFREQDVSHMPGGDVFIPLLQPDGPAPVPVDDGAVLDLGGRTLKVIYTPGHTHGSLCIFDESTGTLFAGDIVMEKVGLCEWNSTSVETYRDSLLRLKELPVKKILCGHKPNIHGPELLDKDLYCAQQILDGAPVTEAVNRDGTKCLQYAADGVCINFVQA